MSSSSSPNGDSNETTHTNCNTWDRGAACLLHRLWTYSLPKKLQKAPEAKATEKKTEAKSEEKKEEAKSEKKDEAKSEKSEPKADEEEGG